MKHTFFFLAGLGWATSISMAGVVTLDPAVATVSQGDIVEFAVTISATDLAEFDAIDVILSSDLADLNLSFTYDASFAPSFPVGTPTAFGIFVSDLFVGGFKADRWQSPILIGTLRVDTATLVPGTYAGVIGARPTREEEETLAALSKVTLGVASETLSGTADIVIIDPDAPIGPTDPVPTVDTDADGVADSIDAFPNDPDETLDTDGDGLGNNADLDDDGDGIEDVDDPTPLGDEVIADTGGDAGTGDTGGETPAGGDGTTTIEETTGGDATPVAVPTCGAGMAAMMFGTFFGLFAVRSRYRIVRFSSHKSAR